MFANQQFVATLDDIGDVVITTAAQFDLVQRNAIGEWVNVTFGTIESAIDHLNISSIGVNSHAVIDAHIADTDIHFSDAPADGNDYARNNNAWVISAGGGVTDHTLLTNIGVNTHAQIDTHIGDATLHFTEASIDHTAIANIGVNSHAAIDLHIANATIHFADAPADAQDYVRNNNAWVVASAGVTDHTLLTNIGVNTHAQLDTHLADATIHFTEASIDHTAISNIGVNTHAAIDLHIADTDIHFSDAPADGETYVRENNVWVRETPGGGLLSSQYRFSTSIVAADPGVGRLRYDNAAIGSVTEIFIDDFNNEGADVSNFLGIIAVGDRIYVQDEGNGNIFAVWNVTAASVDNVGWFTIAVTLESGNGLPSNNSRVMFLLQIGGDSDSIHLRLDTSNDPLTGDLVTQAMEPVDTIRDIGLAASRYRRMFARLGIMVNSVATPGVTLPANANHGGLVAGTQAGIGTNTHRLSAAFPAVAVIGNVATTGAGGVATMEATRGGATAIGSAYAYINGTAIVRSSGYASTAIGYAYGQGTSTLEAISAGSVAFGYAGGRQAANTARLTSGGSGSFAAGFARGFSGGGTAIIESTGRGSFAAGYARTSNANGATIRASGDGSFAQGRCDGVVAGIGLIEATADGAFAVGLDTGGNNIRATATNAAQFGPGVNALADSLQVGAAGIRFKGTAGAPGAPQNGDFWVNGAYVYVRSNGANIQIAGPGPLTN